MFHEGAVGMGGYASELPPELTRAGGDLGRKFNDRLADSR